jgi:head-tail adaptor
MSRPISIGEFKHRLMICSMKDVVIQSATMLLVRQDVYKAWAMIMPKRTSTFSKEGYAVKESNEQASHKILIRYNPHVDVTSAAWLYEERLKSPARWFKILGVANKDECSEYFEFSCRIVEQSDLVEKPVKDAASVVGAMPLPKGVSL